MKTAVFSIVLLTLYAFPASSHLSIIRQGAESAGIIEAGDRHGAAVAAGDFNDDGYDDLAIGAPGEDLAGDVDIGVVVIVWGGFHGLDPAGSLVLTEDDASNGSGVTPGADFGYALLSDDFNHDGIDDLVIGAPGSDPFGSPDEGIVYVMQGSAGGLLPFVSLTALFGSFSGDRFGSSLVAGVFDTTHAYVTLGVGAPGVEGNIGAVDLFETNSLGLFEHSERLRLRFLGYIESPGDQFGFWMATGDAFGGPSDELFVSAPGRTVSGQPSAGLVVQMRGDTRLPTPRLFGSGGFAGGLDAVAVDAAEGNAQFGKALAVGHIQDQAAGKAALIVGEPGRNHSGNVDAGRVLVFPGQTGDSGVLTAGAVVLDQDDGGGSLGPGDQFGIRLLAGRFMDPADGYDDLVVGSIGDDLGLGATSAGQVNILLGGPTGPGNHGWYGFNQSTLNEVVELGDELGFSLALGAFDNSGFGNLAVGAPGEDMDAGMVHVIAPWRQLYGLQCKNSVAYDCLDNLIFSQKPYDPVYIASTTKIMTVLIACERVDAGWINLTDEYVVPDWVADDIGGSQVPLQAGEKVNFWDMMNLCIHLSGNDAAHALADWMYGVGNPSTTVTNFVTEMNLKAAAIGMTGTEFHNPAGLDRAPSVIGAQPTGHFSTPVDMGLLSQVAMQNPRFVSVVNQTTFSMTRQLPDSTNPGQFIASPWTFPTFYGTVLTNAIQPAVGIKGGFTTKAQVTGCFAAQSSQGGIWVAGSYGTPAGLPWMTDAANLLALGAGTTSCGVLGGINTDIITYIPTWRELAAGMGAVSGGGTEIGWMDPGDVRFYTAPDNDPGNLAAGLDIVRISEVELLSAQIQTYGVAPFESHGDLAMVNIDSTAVDVQLSLSYDPTPQMITLFPGVPHYVSAYIPPANLLAGTTQLDPEFTLEVENLSGHPTRISMEEVYRFNLDFSSDPSPFGADVRREGTLLANDSYSFQVTGMSPDPDATLIMTAPPKNIAVVGIEEFLRPVGKGLVPVHRAFPNPSPDRPRIFFELSRESEVGIGIFDLGGRRVRDLGSARLPAGIHEMRWDRRDDSGRAVAAGVYFYRIEAGDEAPVRGKLVLTR